MKKIGLYIGCILFVSICRAQEQKPVRWNFKIGYEAGLQYFNLYYFNSLNNRFVREKMPIGSFYIENYFKPTVLNSFYLSSTVFKNKTYYLTLGLHFSKNETEFYGFTSDNLGNPLKRTTKGWFSSGSFSLGLRKEISLKNCGSIIPGISFVQYYKFDCEIRSRETVIDKFDGTIISDKSIDAGSGGFIGPFHGSPLMFFDNPRVSIEYQKRVYKGLHLGLTYAYQFSGSLEHLYKNAITWDLSGQNISFVAAYRLFGNK